MRRQPARSAPPPRRPPPDWRSDPRLWEPHVDTYRHRRAVERAARKHGRTLGPSFRTLLVMRLRLVDVDRDGCVPSLMACVRLVAGWAREGRGIRG